MISRFQSYSLCAVLSCASLFAQYEEGLVSFNSGNTASEIAANDAKGKKGVPAMPTYPTLILQPCPDTWRFSVDFLYLLPTFDDTYYVTESTPGLGQPEGERYNNDFGFNPAFRVGAEYAFCDTGRDLQVFYTYLHATESGSKSGEGLWASAGSGEMTTNYRDYEGSASSKLKMLYQRLDLNVSQHALNMHGLHLYIQPGIEYAYLRLQESYRFQNVPDDELGTMKRQSKTWGFGPQLGFGLDCNLYSSTPCPDTWGHSFALSTLFSTSILMGQSQTKQRDIDDGSVDLDLRDEYTWRTVPALHARVGLSYLIHGSCMGASLSVGYEFSDYLRGLARTMIPETAAETNAITSYYSYDVQGLDISLAFSF